MRITLLPIPYKVESLVKGWKGWRIHQWGIVWREPCDCDTVLGCAADPLAEDEPCKCAQRPPHTHTWAGYLGSRPIHYPYPRKQQ